jgi:hypothetical protein
MNSILEKLSMDRKSSSPSASFFPAKTAQERTCPAGKTGGEAGRILARPGSFGKVLASLPGTIYIMDDEEEVLWLSTDRFPMHRRCLQVSLLPPPQFLWPGQRFFVQNSTLCVGDFFLIDLRSLKDWIPPSISSGQAKPLAEVRHRSDQFFRFIQGLGPLEGLGRLIPLIFKMAEGKEGSLTPPDPATARFLVPILEIGKACPGRNMAKILEKGKDLIGLGPGLTPSGDDFLGGLLFSAFLLREEYPNVFLWDPARVSDFTAWARLETNPISHAFLNDLALGHGPAHLHEVMNFLIQGNDFEKAVSAASQFLRFGHSSGADILAGLMTGMLMVS